ncbi:MAG: aldo/keto reductase [Hyphomicrobiaceae bacterium]|nr:aldo/keto reductase [Hyphomicrobiaceae bacterium]
MEMRRLGAFGPLVSSVSLGAMSLSGMYGATTESETMRLLSRSVELGINHIDLADIFGMGLGEELIGRFLAQSRARLVLATKAGVRFVPATGERRIDNSPAYLRAALEKSLKRLGRDHVELFYVHRRDGERPIEDVVATLADLKREGKIGGIGLSEVSPETLRRASRVTRISAVQSEYSLWTRGVEAEMLATCRDLGVAFIAFSPLGRGMLTGGPIDPATFGRGDFRRANPRFQEPAFGQNRTAIDAFVALAAKRGVPPSALAIAWVLAADRHVIAIPGTRSVEHLEIDALAATLRMSAADRAEIAAVFPDGFPWGERYAEGQLLGVEPSSNL